MSPDNRCGTGFRNRALQRILYGLRLTSFWHAADPRIGSEKPSAGDRERFTRHRLHVSKVAFASLLPPASLVEDNALHDSRIVKIRYVRVIKRYVAVLAKPDES